VEIDSAGAGESEGEKESEGGEDSEGEKESEGEKAVGTIGTDEGAGEKVGGTIGTDEKVGGTMGEGCTDTTGRRPTIGMLSTMGTGPWLIPALAANLGRVVVTYSMICSADRSDDSVANWGIHRSRLG